MAQEIPRMFNLIAPSRTYPRENLSATEISIEFWQQFGEWTGGEPATTPAMEKLWAAAANTDVMSSLSTYLTKYLSKIPPKHPKRLQIRPKILLLECSEIDQTHLSVSVCIQTCTNAFQKVHIGSKRSNRVRKL